MLENIHTQTKSSRRLLCLVVKLIFISFSPAILCAQSCLWRATGGQNTVYLLGSIHVLKEDHYPLKKQIEVAYRDSQLLAFEIHIDSVIYGLARYQILQKALNPEGRTLKHILGAKTYALAELKARELGIDIGQMDAFKPWFFTMRLTTLKIQSLGFDPTLGVDRYFFERAREEGKEVTALESINNQIIWFDRLPKARQRSLVLQTLEELDVIDKELDYLLSLWESGHVDSLGAIILKSFEDHADIYQSLILDRNTKWLEKIEKYLRSDRNVMVIVGAGHLLGEKGIVAVLREKGISVEQL